MNSERETLTTMLKLALKTMNTHHEYYSTIAESVETTAVKALLLVLAETEDELINKIHDMLATGIVEEIDEISNIGEVPVPDETPFDPSRNDTDPRIFICNKALKQEVKAYTFFLSIAVRAKSRVVSYLFEYFAYVKYQQIEKIRRVCSTF